MSITLSVVLKRHSFLSLAKQLDGSEGPGQGGRMLFPKGMGFETTWTSLAFSHVKKWLAFVEISCNKIATEETARHAGGRYSLAPCKLVQFED